MDVSIIISNYNNKPYLGRAIRSCLNQTMERGRYEVIVVDDSSTDNSQDVLAGYKDKIIPIYLEKNVGVAEASNTGIRGALGRYVIRVDSDDYINENTILFLSQILDANHDIGFVYSDHLRVDKTETVIERVNLDTPDKIFRHGAGIMFRKSYLELLGLYDSEFKNAEDFELLKRYFKNWNGFRLPLPLYRYRQHDSNMTHDEKSRKEWERKADAKHIRKNK